MIFQRNVKLSALLFAVGFALSLTLPSFAFALNEAPRTFTLDGRIFSSPTSSTPLLGAVTVNVKILDPSGLCILYEEEQAYNTTLTNGYFNIPVGSVTGAVKRVGDDPNHTMETIYQNTALISAVNAGCGGGYTPAAGDARLVRVTVTPVATGIAQVFSPDMRLDAVPTAVVAESIQGLSRDNMLELNTNVELTQSNIENVFSVANYPVLTSLLAGTSSLYMKASPSAAVSFNGQQITNVAAPTLGTDATNKTYVDSNIGGKAADTVVFAGIAAGDAGKVMVWDGTKWTAAAPAGDVTKLPLAGGTMTGAINMGSQNLLATGHITMSSQTTLNLGTYTNAQEAVLVLGLGGVDAGKFWYNTDVPGLKVWNGSTAVAAVQSGTSAGGDLSGTYPNPTIAANAVVAAKINDSAVTGAKILDATITGADIAGSTITDTNIAGVGAGKITSGAGVYFTYAPNNTPCTDGQYMRWDNTNTRWVCGTPTDNGITALTGDVTASGNGSVAATISNDAVSNPKLAALAVTDAKVNDVGVGKISSGAGQYFSYRPGNTACADGQVLSWDNTNSRWVCAAATAGSVTSIATGTGLAGGPINSVGTISIAPGGVSATELATDAVTSTKILDGTIATIDIADNAISENKINAFAVTTPKLFANPGANYLVMTDGVAGSTLVAKSCSPGEILKWSVTGWGCAADSTSGGTVTGIATGTGLTGGPITGAGTVELSSSVLNGLWSVNGSDVYRASGNVGIGTSTPGAKLTVGMNGSSNKIQVGVNVGNFIEVGWEGGYNFIRSSDSFAADGTGLVLQDQGGSVGIGTSSPNSILTVAGVTALGETTAPAATTGYGKLYVKSADSKLYFMDDAGLEKNISDSAAGGTVTGIATGTGLTGGPIGTTGTISLATNVVNGLWSGDGTNVYRTTGNVGIGTTAPTARFQTDGAGDQEIWFAHNDNISGRRVKLRLTNSNPGYYQNGPSFEAIEGSGLDQYHFAMNMNGYPVMYVDSSLNAPWANPHIGFGTTSPQARVQIKGVSSDAGRAALNVVNSGDASMFFVRNDGNVGVGTTAPLDRISIASPLVANSSNALLNLSNTALVDGSANGTYIGANPAAFAGDWINFQTAGSDFFKVTSSSDVIAGSFQARVPGQAAQLAAIHSGNKEFGMNADWVIRWGNSSGVTNYFSTTPDTGIAKNAPGVLEINNGTAGQYRDLQARAINPAAGNLGIGTTVPNSLLTVAGVTALGETTAPASTSGYGKLYVKSADSKLYFMDDAGVEKNISDSAAGGTVTGIATGAGLTGGPITGAGTISLDSSITNGLWSVNGASVYRSSGNVGIGTTAPSSLLNISSTTTPLLEIDPGGNSTADPAIHLKDTGAGGGFKIWYDNDAGDTYFDAKGGVPTYGTYFRTQVDAAPIYNLSLLNGKVGVLTSNPQSALDVGGEIRATDGGGAIEKGSFLRWNAAGYGEIGAYDWQNSLVKNIVVPSGNLGIGTTAPTAKLEVNGDAKINTVTVGLGAGSNNGGSSAFGVGVLGLNTTGYNNNAFGSAAMQFNTEGRSNNAFGKFALRMNDLYSYNSAFGDEALYDTKANFNSAFGAAAGKAITSGAGNTLVGQGAGQDITTGEYNLILFAGVNTPGTSITTGSHNILIGRDVRPPSQTASNQLNIGNLIYSNGIGMGTTAATGNVGIGTTSPNAKLTVEGVTALGETVAPALTSGYGKLYVKSADSKLYFMDDAGVEKNISDSAAGGTVTGIATGTGLTGGPINGAGTISLDSSITSGLWSVNGANIYRSSGFVGIGTTNPANYLDVNGNTVFRGSNYMSAIAFSTSSFSSYGSLNGTGDDGTHISLGSIDGEGNHNLIFTSAANWSRDHDHDTFSTNPTVFYHSATDPDVNNAEWGSLSFEGTGSGGGFFKVATGVGNLALVPAGNVGIGTTSPAAALNLVGPVGSNGAIFVKTNQNQGNGDIMTLEAGNNTDAFVVSDVGNLATKGSAHFNRLTGNDGSTLITRISNNAVIRMYDSVGSTPFNEFQASGNSYFNGGNVGIGTTAPATKLDVNGTITATGFSGPITSSVVGAGAGTEGAPSISFSADPDTGWWSPAADTLAASTSGAERVRIDSSGKVGVGTTLPVGKLDVAGDLYVREIGTSTSGTTQYDSRRLVLRGTYWDGSNSVDQDVYIFNDANPPGAAMRFNVGGVNAFAIFSNEIQAIQPIKHVNAKLELKGRPADGATAIGTEIGNDTTLTTAGAKLLSIKNGAAERAYIDKDGGAYFSTNVGIGTTSPGNILHAKVSDASTNTVTNLLRLEHESSGTPAASFGTGILFTGESTTTLNRDMAQIDSVWTTATDASRASALRFSTVTAAGALTERVRISATGNVGIGVTAPAEVLDVQGGYGSGLKLRGPIADNNWHGGLQLTNSTNAAAGGTINGSVNGMFFGFGGSERMRISSAGYLGVNTTGPAYPLDVAGIIRSSVGGIMFPDGSVMTTAAAAGTGMTSITDLTFAADTDTNGTGAVTFSTNALERMRVDNSGNVGIGTVNPQSPLHVAGNAFFTGGQVGIGTTSPTNTLTVTGSARINASGTSPLTIDNANQTNVRSLSIINKGAGNTGIAIGSLLVGDSTGSQYQYDLANGSLLYQVRGNGAGAGVSAHTFSIDSTAAGTLGRVVEIRSGAAGADLLSLRQSDNTEIFKVRYDGNVGIGTTAPAVALDLGSKTNSVRMPAGTTAQRPGTPANGDIRYNSTLSTLEGYMYGAWTAINNAIVGRVDITSTPYTITSTQPGIYFSYNNAGAGVINLPSIASIPDGWQVTIMRKVAQSVTITPNGGDTFANGMTTLEMRGNNLASVTLTNNGGNWAMTNKTDDCIVGQACWAAGNLYVGTYKGKQYFTTPGGCTDSATPTCAGGTDTVTKAWSSSATTNVGGGIAGNTATVMGTQDFTDGTAVCSTCGALGSSAYLATQFTDTAAAKYCENMTYAGYSDWYLPSKEEMGFLYRNSQSIGGFVYSLSYWSSSEYNNTIATNFLFTNGSINNTAKTTAYYVRCVRRF